MFHITFKKLFIVVFLGLLVYTRFAGLDWGLPYPMHPDERNMSVAVLEMECTGLNLECMNPHFYAYGQLPLYGAYFISKLYLAIFPDVNPFNVVTLILRAFSAISSVLTAWLLWKMTQVLFKPTRFTDILVALSVIFVPSFIQFAHFGTTESLLMLLSTALLYLAILFLKGQLTFARYILRTGIVLGVAIGIKVSSLFLGAIPLFVFILTFKRDHIRRSIVKFIVGGFILLFITAVFFILTSPYNILGFEEFMGAMRYESDVGFGNYRAFYTRQFEYTIPVLFQMLKVFPYTLGVPFFVLFLASFFILPFNKVNNILRLLFLIFFLPNAFLYAKWSRFLAALYPLMMLFVLSLLMHMYTDLSKNSFFKKYKTIEYGFFIVLIGISILPGLAYMSIYHAPDIRFTASDWISKNIPNDTVILSETANVVDIPFPTTFPPVDYKLYSPISFNFYDLHIVPELEQDLQGHVGRAEYVFVPSRRVFANHTCMWPTAEGFVNRDDSRTQLLNGYESERCNKLKDDYQIVNHYYNKILDPTQYELIYAVASYPSIKLFGRTLLEFPDEHAEETWTVFDHPVIRIYKKI